MDQSKQIELSRPPWRPGRMLLAVTAVALTALAVTGCGGSDGEQSASDQPPLEPSVGRPIQVGGSPVAVAAGSGAVWVANETRASVSRLDPATGRVLGGPIRVGAGPAAIAAGGGAVYVACGDDTIWRIDPATATATRGAVRIGDPAGIAYGEGGVWVTSASDGTLTRLDPDALAGAGTPIAVGAQPGDVVVGDGRAWVAGVRDGTVSSVDTSTEEVSATVSAGEFGVLALALDDEGRVVAARTDDRLARQIELVRIDPDSGELSGDPVAVPGAAIPIRLAAGEGAVWATIAGGPAPPEFKPRPAALAYLPDGAGELEDRLIEVGAGPSGVAVGAGRVWVTSAQEGTATPVAVR
jgi:streptogramin lyase